MIHLPAQIKFQLNSSNPAVTAIIAGPLTHIVNTFIEISSFPEVWKIARITPIPKNESITTESDMRPISILPVLSKVFERLVHQQVVSFIDSQDLFKGNMSGFRKGHSTTTVLLRIRDDIIKAMKRGEVTLMILTDFSKAFDTIKYKTVLKKLNYLGFSKSFLNWTIEYLTDRWHFVQVDDKTSDRRRVNFGVPQGSIMRPLIFNLYVADLHAHVNMQCHQYADDTTLYVHCKPSNLESYKRDLNNSLCNLEEWSSNANLVINLSNIKMMVLSTKQLSSAHAIEHLNMKIAVNNENIERVPSTKLLGTYINQHLK